MQTLEKHIYQGNGTSQRTNQHKTSKNDCKPTNQNGEGKVHNRWANSIKAEPQIRTSSSVPWEATANRTSETSENK